MERLLDNSEEEHRQRGDGEGNAGRRVRDCVRAQEDRAGEAAGADDQWF